MTKKQLHSGTAVLACLLIMAGNADADQVKQNIEKPVGQAVIIEQKTQADQVSWRAEKEKKTQRFNALEKEVAALEKEAVQKKELNEVLKTEMERKRKQVESIAQIETQISPFLNRLLIRINDLYHGDLPFLQEERQKRIQALEKLNKDPNSQVSEKFRKIMEGLMVEAEYGRTVEVYQQTISLSGEKTLVNIFRLGRLRLFYQTLDKQECGFYNTAQKIWVPLDQVYHNVIQAAVDMGSRRKPVGILDLPLGRMAIQ
ncbi:MAG: DUF3450 domain-containing protein [Desulfobacterales bacterium]|nr:DUF3450 domain-containing protein [Desulfobacterales bacterium]